MPNVTKKARQRAQQLGIDPEALSPADGAWVREGDVEAAYEALQAAAAPGPAVEPLQEPEVPVEAPRESSAEPEMITVVLSDRAPFTAVALPGTHPGVVLQRGQSARVPAACVEAMVRAFEKGALPKQLRAFIEIEPVD